MGAWGPTAFDSDEGMDWFDEFCDGGQQLREIERAFADVIGADQFIDYDYCMGALVAAEIIAAAKGKPSEAFPEDEYFETGDELGHTIHKPDLQVISNYIDMTLIGSANVAVEKLLTSLHSEVRQLWEESEDFEEWKAYMEDLKIRLS